MLKHVISSFMDCHWHGTRPLLLAFSGGPDSLALLHLLLDYCRQKGLQPHECLALAHVDHGWRAESEEESRQIAEMAKYLGLTLHQKKLEPLQTSKNLEEACREERLHFFSNLCQEHAYQAVLLGQHADDQAETVLKRIFEGASLFKLTGIKATTSLQGVAFWRPLIHVSKHQLGLWLTERHLKGFDDYTNRDCRFLRAKMRTAILPELAQMFGKEISSNLLNLGTEAAELGDYMAEKMAPLLQQMQGGPFGTFFDFNQQPPLMLLEVKYLVRACCKSENIHLSRANIQKAAEMLLNKAANKSLSAENTFIHIDRGILFALANTLKSPSKYFLLLEPGTHTFGSWTVTVSMIADAKKIPKEDSWRNVWQGKLQVILPVASYQMTLPVSSASLSKWWTNAKVPAFLRDYVPAIYDQGLLVHEFLSGRRRTHDPNGKALKIQLEAIRQPSCL